MTNAELSTEADSNDCNQPNKTPQKPSNKAPKKRRWLRRLTWCVVVLGILAFFVNGIVARKVVHHFLNKSLEDQGMTGTVEIEGSILGGFQVKDLDYTGEKGIQALNIDDVAVDYQIIQLIDLKIDALSVSNVTARIDIAKFPPTEKKEDTMDWKATLRDLYPLVMHPDISLEELDVTVLNDGKKMLQWELGSIEHSSGTDMITLNKWVISDSENLKTPEQSATVVWQENVVNIDSLRLLPQLALGEIHLDWESKLKAHTSVSYHDAIIEMDIAEKASLKLLEGEIKSEEVFKTLVTFGVKTDELDLDAIVSALDVSLPTDDFKSPIPKWNVDASLGIKSARYENYQVANTNLKISQAGQHFDVNIDGTAVNAPLKLDLKGDWTAPDSEQWWESTSAEVSFQTQVNDDILALIPGLENVPQEIKLNSTRIQGNVVADLKDSELINTKADVEVGGVSVRESPFPALSISLNQKEDDIQFKIATKDSTGILVVGNFSPDREEYKATFTAKTSAKESPWINTLAETYESPVMLNGQIDIQWSGSGKLTSDVHIGKLTTSNLKFSQKNLPPVTVNLEGSYDWPNSIDVKNLSAEQEELFASVSMIWDGKTLSLNNSEIKRDGELIGSIKGKLPYSLKIDDSKKFFAQTEPWEISIDTEKLLIKRMMELIPMEKNLDLSGTLQTKLNISGSPRTPEINGDIDLVGMNDIFDIGLGKISLNAQLATQDKLLNIDGNLLEGDLQRIALDLQLPFTPHQWLEDDNLLETIQTNSQIKGTAEIKKLPLNRFTKLVPDLEKLEGVLDAKAEFQGTIAEPKYNINFNAELPIVSLKNAGVDDITNITIKGVLDQTMILNSEVGAKINGGAFNTMIQVDVNDPKKPIFDVKLTTDHALVYRDDVLAMRANANLAVKGTLEDALITGNIGILESLFYKDVDLIPIGVPTSAVDAVTLPALDTKAKETLPIPAPFDQWKLDLVVNTEDPILIRGNIGSGQIKGSVNVRGTLSKPSLDGTLVAEKVRAKLPFSLLRVNDGKIRFTPGNGFIPTLDIRGKSQVGEHNVSIYAYGSADDPKITLSSYPALPENEIMTLLATGTTNAGLANRDVATFKTLQILLQELKQRNDRPGGNRLFKTVLSGIDDLDLKVGEANELTGEKYASATVKLHRRWYLTAQIDNNQPPQTRGLVIFALRFQ